MKKIPFIAAGMAILLGTTQGYAMQDIRSTTKTMLSCPETVKISELQEIKKNGRVVIGGVTFIAYDMNDLKANVPSRLQLKGKEIVYLVNDQDRT